MSNNEQPQADTSQDLFNDGGYHSQTLKNFQKARNALKNAREKRAKERLQLEQREYGSHK